MRFVDGDHEEAAGVGVLVRGEIVWRPAECRRARRRRRRDEMRATRPAAALPSTSTMKSSVWRSGDGAAVPAEHHGVDRDQIDAGAENDVLRATAVVRVPTRHAVASVQ